MFIINNILFYTYNVIILVISTFVVILLLSKGQKNLLLQRFFVPKPKKIKKEVILFHASSIGELIGILELIKYFKDKFDILLTLQTNTAYSYAKKIFDKERRIEVILLPIDFCGYMRVLFGYVKPHALIIAETELWPSLLVEAKKNHATKIILINGRISNTSFRRYKLIKFFLRFILKNFDLLSMQTEEDAKRIIDLGAPSDKVRVIGNSKFDLLIEDNGLELPNIYKSIKDNSSIPIFVCGSLWKYEDEVIIEVCKDLLHQRRLFLIICPRHLRRIKYIKKLLKKHNIVFIMRSNQEIVPANTQVLLVDRYGELKNIYKIADIVFVGGSLINIGGHNIAEPAILKKPIIFGEYIGNYKELADELVVRGGAFIVKDKQELKEKICYLLDNEYIRELMGKKAYSVIKASQGATSKNIKLILSHLGLYS